MKEHPLKELWDLLREGYVPEPCAHPDCTEQNRPGWVYCSIACGNAMIDGAECVRCETADQSDGRPDIKEGFPHPSGMCAACEAWTLTVSTSYRGSSLDEQRAKVCDVAEKGEQRRGR